MTVSVTARSTTVNLPSECAWCAGVAGWATAVALGGYGCVDDVTPDWMPLLGPVDGCQGLIAAYGMSSHFFKHAPAVGRGLAEYITDGGSSLVDFHLFRPERFREGAGIRSAYPYGSAATL